MRSWDKPNSTNMCIVRRANCVIFLNVLVQTFKTTSVPSDLLFSTPACAAWHVAKISRFVLLESSI